MQKDYKNKQMKSDEVKNKRAFFFPKANPPITIEAETIEEAEKQLQIIQKKDNE